MFKKQQQTVAYEYICVGKKEAILQQPELVLNFACAYIEPSLHFENI